MDFITETEKEVVFIEYKNGNIENAVNPDAMLQKIKHESFYHKIARKFYDSLLVFWACKGNEKELPIGLLLFFIEKLADGFTSMVGEGDFIGFFDEATASLAPNNDSSL